jgi:glutamine cyclotransferase
MEHQSHLLRHDPTDQMKTLDKIPLTPSHLFGEGISHYYVWRTDTIGNPMKEHRLIQLTWKHRIGKIYSLPNTQLIQEFSFDTSTGEGWGITFIPHRNEFYVSDGSENLIVWDAETLVEKRRIVVTFEREPGSVDIVRYVNELEFVDFSTNEPQTSRDESYSLCEESGICSDVSSTSFAPTMKILANVWYQDVLVSIDPETGRIGRVFDLRDIYPIDQRNDDGADCLNGISVTNDRASDENCEGLDVWVTGKLWPKMYRIRLID